MRMNARNRRSFWEQKGRTTCRGMSQSPLPAMGLALEMIHAVYASHLSGARVRLPLTNREHPLA